MADFTGNQIRHTYQRLLQLDDFITQNGTGSINLETVHLSGSLYVTGSQVISENLHVLGNVTAQQFIASTVSSSIVYESGSSQFGNSLDDIHRFTGSIYSSGGLYVEAGGNENLKVYDGNSTGYNGIILTPTRLSRNPNAGVGGAGNGITSSLFELVSHPTSSHLNLFSNFNYNGYESPRDFTIILDATDPSWIVNSQGYHAITWSYGPAIVNSISNLAFPEVVGFDGPGGFGDNRVTFLTPISASSYFTGSVEMRQGAIAPFFSNPQTYSYNSTIPPGHNSRIFGPITVAAGTTLTVGANAKLEIIDI